jgi:hypothetical protein
MNKTTGAEATASSIAFRTSSDRYRRAARVMGEMRWNLVASGAGRASWRKA